MNTKALTTVSFLLAISGSAHAHPGAHSSLQAGNTLEHLANSPFHIAVLAGVVVVAVLVRNRFNLALQSAKRQTRKPEEHASGASKLDR